MCASAYGLQQGSACGRGGGRQGEERARRTLMSPSLSARPILIRNGDLRFGYSKEDSGEETTAGKVKKLYLSCLSRCRTTTPSLS